MGAAHIIPLSGAFLFLGIILLAALWWLALWSVKSVLRNQDKSQTPRDWAVPKLDSAADGNSLFHRWDVRFKLVALIGFAFLVVATRSPWSALLAMGLSFSAVLLARLPLERFSVDVPADYAVDCCYSTR